MPQPHGHGMQQQSGPQVSNKQDSQYGQPVQQSMHRTTPTPSDFNMDGMEKLIYLHVVKLGESLTKEPRSYKSDYKDSAKVWYVIKRGSNDSVAISPVFEDIKPFNYQDPALRGTECQVIGSCIYVIGGWSLGSFPSLHENIPGSKEIRCLDTRNPKEGCQNCFTLPFPACDVRSAVDDDQWLYFFGGLRPKGSSYPWGYALNVDDFSKDKVKEISRPDSTDYCYPVVSSLSPDTLVVYTENEGILHQLVCTTNSWTVLLKDLPSSLPADIVLGMSTICDGVLYLIDLDKKCFISYDIGNRKELVRVELPYSFVGSFQDFVNLIVLAKNKFCIVWESAGQEFNQIEINYIRFSVSYDFPNPTQLLSRRESVLILEAEDCSMLWQLRRNDG